MKRSKSAKNFWLISGNETLKSWIGGATKLCIMRRPSDLSFSVPAREAVGQNQRAVLHFGPKEKGAQPFRPTLSARWVGKVCTATND